MLDITVIIIDGNFFHRLTRDLAFLHSFYLSDTYSNFTINSIFLQRENILLPPVLQSLRKAEDPAPR